MDGCTGGRTHGRTLTSSSTILASSGVMVRRSDRGLPGRYEGLYTSSTFFPSLSTFSATETSTSIHFIQRILSVVRDFGTVRFRRGEARTRTGCGSGSMYICTSSEIMFSGESCPGMGYGIKSAAPRLQFTAWFVVRMLSRQDQLKTVGTPANFYRILPRTLLGQHSQIDALRYML